MTISEMLRRLDNLDLKQEAQKVFEERSPELIDMNTGQLSDGKTSLGEEITPEYHDDFYATLKHRLNPKPPKYTPDLNLTGSFYGGFKIEVKKDSLLFLSTDSKTESLEKKYSSSIFGLTDANKKEFSFGYLFEDLKGYITKVTGLRFK